jgi:hypothetical protein
VAPIWLITDTRLDDSQSPPKRHDYKEQSQSTSYFLTLDRPAKQRDPVDPFACSPSDYEEDHFIPLELGGAPKNPKNLWPEPHAQSRKSDPLENKLKRQVCKHLMTLRKARAAIRLFKNTQG